jgi:hypothetical protein
LKISDFKFGTTPDGKRTVELLGLNTDKTQKLSFGCTNLRQDFVGANVWQENPNDDFCGVRIIYFYIQEHLPLGYTDRLFLRRASQKVIRQRQRDGNTREAGLGPYSTFGKNYCNYLCKQLAFRVKLDNPEKQTGRSKRRTAVTHMAATLPGGMLREASRHRSAETNARYQTETDGSRLARATCFNYNAPEKQAASTSPPVVAPPMQQQQPAQQQPGAFTSPPVVAQPMQQQQPAQQQPPPGQQQLVYHYPQGNVVQQPPRPAHVQYMVPMGVQYPVPNTTVFTGNVPGNVDPAPPFPNTAVFPGNVPGNVGPAPHFPNTAVFPGNVPGNVGPAPQFPNTAVFPGNAGPYQQQYTGTAPQGPPHSNFSYLQQHP